MGAVNMVEIIAQGYRDALIGGADMLKATDALTAIRDASAGDDLYRIWDEIDSRIGLTLDIKDVAVDGPLRSVLIRLRSRFEEESRTAVISRLREDFEEAPAKGWKSWMKTFAEALSLWRFSFCSALVEEQFFPPEEKRDEMERIRKLMPLVLHERWPEAKGLFDALAGEEALAAAVRAKLFVTCGEIELFQLNYFKRANQLFSSAETLAPDEGRVICGRAQYYLALNEVDEAKKAFNRAIKQAPRFADGYTGMGELYEMQSDLRSSEEWYREAVRVASGNTWGYIKLMRLYGRPELFGSFEEKAHALYDHVCRLNPLDAYSAAVDMGNSYQQNGMAEKAQQWFQKAIDLDPARVGGYIASGYAYLSDRKPDQARSRFEHADETAPDAFDTPSAMASLSEQENRWEDALTWYERSIAKRPEWRTAVGSKMNELLWRYMGKRAEAEENLLALLREDPVNRTLRETLHNLVDTCAGDRRTDEAVRILTVMRTIIGESYEAEFRYRTGSAKMMSGLIEEAVESYRQATGLDDGKAAYFIGLGDALRKLDRLDEAEAAYRGALSIEPARPEYLNSMGNVLFEAGRYGESVPYYQKACLSSPQTAVYHSNLGGSYWELGDLEKAKNAYGEAVRLDPSNGEYENKLGSVLYELNEYEESIGHYEQAIKANPEKAVYHVNIGRSKGSLGRWDEMVDHCRKAVELRRAAKEDSHGFDYYYGFLAEGYIKAGRFGEFEEYSEKSRDLEGEPEKKAIVYNRIGNLLASSFEEERAIAYYLKAASLDDKRPIYECNIGVTYRTLGRWKEMIEHCRRAVELRRGVTDDVYGFDYYYEFLAEGYFRAERLSEFTDLLEKGGDLDDEQGKKAVIYNRIGNLFFEKGGYEESLPFYAKAVELSPGMAVYHANLGGSCRALGRFDEARVSYAQAVEIEPGNGEYQNILGYIFFSLGRYEESLPHYLKAIEANPGDALYHGNIGTSYAALGRWEEAKDAFSKALDLDVQPLYLCSFGRACGNLGGYDEMVEHCRRAVELRRGVIDDVYGLDYYYEFLAEGYFRAGRLSEFEEYFEKSRDLGGEPEKKAIVYNRIGNLLASSFEEERAIAYYLKAASLDDKRPIYECNIGVTYRTLGRWKEMIEHCRRAVELRRGVTDDVYGFDYYYEFLAEGYFKAGRLSEFEEYFGKSPDFEGADEKKAVVNNRVGNLYFDVADYGEAVPWFSRAIEAAPSAGVYLANRGLARSKLGLLADAEADYREAVRIEPENPEYRNMLGNVCFETGSYRQALDEYQRAFSLEGQPIYACNLGRAYGNLGEWEKMIEHCSKAVELRRVKPDDPYGPDYYYGFLAEAYVGAGKVAELREILDRSEDFSSEPGKKADLYNLAGNLSARKIWYDDAITFYIQAVSLVRSNAVYFANLGLAFQGKGDLVNAEAAYIEAVRLDPSNPEYGNFLGNVYFAAGAFGRAAELYLKAISLNAPVAVYRSNLVLACRELWKSQKQEALSLLEQAVTYEGKGSVLTEAIEEFRKTGQRDTP